MPTHAETRRMPYTAAQMYALIADVERYPAFLPWCEAVRVRNRIGGPAEEVIEADLVISFKVFRERFGSRVTLRPGDAQAPPTPHGDDATPAGDAPGDWTIDVAYLDGPFRYLNNHWRFTPAPDAPDAACDVSFFVDFEFRSRTLQAVIGVVFNEAMQRIVRAFERRADALYGAPASG